MLVKMACWAVVLTAVLAGCTSPEPLPGNQTGGPTTGTGADQNMTGGDGTQPNATTPTPTPPTPAGGSAVDVSMVDNENQPRDVMVPSGGVVRYTNNGQALHGVTIQKDGSLLLHADQDVDPGQQLDVTFADPGLYRLRCKYHSDGYDSGMVGTITVT